jgi:hypothetical protein
MKIWSSNVFFNLIVSISQATRLDILEVCHHIVVRRSTILAMVVTAVVAAKLQA